jgi:hypothetical protein
MNYWRIRTEISIETAPIRGFPANYAASASGPPLAWLLTLSAKSVAIE